MIFDSIYVRVCGDFWASKLTIFTIFLQSVVKLFLCLTGDKFIAHQNAFTCEEKGWVEENFLGFSLFLNLNMSDVNTVTPQGTGIASVINQ